MAAGKQQLDAIVCMRMSQPGEMGTCWVPRHSSMHMHSNAMKLLCALQPGDHINIRLTKCTWAVPVCKSLCTLCMKVHENSPSSPRATDRAQKSTAAGLIYLGQPEKTCHRTALGFLEMKKPGETHKGSVHSILRGQPAGGHRD